MKPPTSGMTRAAFMRRVRQALVHDRVELSAADVPRSDPALIRLCHLGERVLERFADGARGAGMAVTMLDHGALPEFFADLLCGMATGGRVALSIEDDALRSVVEQAVASTAWVATDARCEAMTGLFDVAVGVTDVDLAIAETGTLVICSTARRSRGTHLIPDVHVALVREHDIVPDLIDVCSSAEMVKRFRDCAACVMVTGPSKTADIEGVLVTGVHGPREVHVIVVREEHATQ